jgi:P27 family predicted phage terminase small subunit
MAPKMPSGLCAAAQAAWRDYWGDTVSGVLRPSDTAIVLRWVRNTDRCLRLLAEADREPVVVGSTGQPKPNPLYALALAFEKSIREDEAQLGIGPLSRLKLGAQLSEAAKTLSELNAEATHANQDDDPRVALSVVADRDA